MTKIFRKVAFSLCVGILCALTICAVFLPDIHREIIPYRFYNVLTNSMEPTVGTHSLVLVKAYDDHVQLKKDDIIVFLANRFGEKIMIMHRFSHTEKNEEGEIVYKTRPDRSDTPDIYETRREDILGVYLWHIPYVGKWILFLKSAFGLLWLCQITVILLIKKLILARWEEKKKLPDEDVCTSQTGNSMGM